MLERLSTVKLMNSLSMALPLSEQDKQVLLETIEPAERLYAFTTLLGNEFQAKRIRFGKHVNLPFYFGETSFSGGKQCLNRFISLVISGHSQAIDTFEISRHAREAKISTAVFIWQTK
jgi:hypothetical protein